MQTDKGRRTRTVAYAPYNVSEKSPLGPRPDGRAACGRQSKSSIPTKTHQWAKAIGTLRRSCDRMIVKVTRQRLHRRRHVKGKEEETVGCWQRLLKGSSGKAAFHHDETMLNASTPARLLLASLSHNLTL